MAWAPGHSIIYRSHRNRVWVLLDPETGIERPLIDPRAADTLGWVFSPSYSSDGRSLMFWWNRLRDGETGIWSIDVHTSRARLLRRLDRTVAIGWIDAPAAMRDLYAGTGAGDFLRIPLDTLLPIELLPSPFSTGTVVRRQRSPGTWICAVAESNADVWLVEPFLLER